MTSSTKHSKTYLKFLSLAAAIHELPGIPNLDSTEEKLLNLLALNIQKGNQVNVLEAMNLLPDTSPATVHRRLKTLRKKNMIKLNVDVNDNRIKHIEITDLANEYFSKLGQCLNQASKI
jgi:DNA-binding MarR family transcriptional regulator